MYEQAQAELGSKLHDIIMGTDGWTPVNKALTRKVGLGASILYGELLNKYRWYFNNKKLNQFGEFYSTLEEIEKDTTLDKRNQKKAIAILVAEGLISVHNRVPPGGQRATRHFKIILNPTKLRKTMNVLKKEDTYQKVSI